MCEFGSNISESVLRCRRSNYEKVREHVQMTVAEENFETDEKAFETKRRRHLYKVSQSNCYDCIATDLHKQSKRCELQASQRQKDYHQKTDRVSLNVAISSDYTCLKIKTLGLEVAKLVKRSHGDLKTTLHEPKKKKLQQDSSVVTSVPSCHDKTEAVRSDGRRVVKCKHVFSCPMNAESDSICVKTGSGHLLKAYGKDSQNHVDWCLGAVSPKRRLFNQRNWFNHGADCLQPKDVSADSDIELFHDPVPVKRKPKHVFASNVFTVGNQPADSANKNVPCQKLAKPLINVLSKKMTTSRDFGACTSLEFAADKMSNLKLRSKQKTAILKMSQSAVKERISGSGTELSCGRDGYQWFSRNPVVVKYRDGRRISGSQLNVALSQVAVKVPSVYYSNDEMDGIGNECLLVWKMTKRDIRELKEQVRYETEHQKSDCALLSGAKTDPSQCSSSLNITACSPLRLSLMSIGSDKKPCMHCGDTRCEQPVGICKLVSTGCNIPHCGECSGTNMFKDSIFQEENAPMEVNHCEAHAITLESSDNARILVTPLNEDSVSLLNKSPFSGVCTVPDGADYIVSAVEQRLGFFDLTMKDEKQHHIPAATSSVGSDSLYVFDEPDKCCKKRSKKDLANSQQEISPKYVNVQQLDTDCLDGAAVVRDSGIEFMVAGSVSEQGVQYLVHETPVLGDAKNSSEDCVSVCMNQRQASGGICYVEMLLANQVAVSGMVNSSAESCMRDRYRFDSDLLEVSNGELTGSLGRVTSKDQQSRVEIIEEKYDNYSKMHVAKEKCSHSKSSNEIYSEGFGRALVNSMRTPFREQKGSIKSKSSQAQCIVQSGKTEDKLEGSCTIKHRERCKNGVGSGHVNLSNKSMYSHVRSNNCGRNSRQSVQNADQKPSNTTSQAQELCSSSKSRGDASECDFHDVNSSEQGSNDSSTDESNSLCACRCVVYCRKQRSPFFVMAFIGLDDSQQALYFNGKSRRRRQWITHQKQKTSERKRPLKSAAGESNEQMLVADISKRSRSERRLEIQPPEVTSSVMTVVATDTVVERDRFRNIHPNVEAPRDAGDKTAAKKQLMWRNDDNFESSPSEIVGENFIEGISSTKLDSTRKLMMNDANSLYRDCAAEVPTKTENFTVSSPANNVTETTGFVKEFSVATTGIGGSPRSDRKNSLDISSFDRKTDVSSEKHSMNQVFKRNELNLTFEQCQEVFTANNQDSAENPAVETGAVCVVDAVASPQIASETVTAVAIELHVYDQSLPNSVSEMKQLNSQLSADCCSKSVGVETSHISDLPPAFSFREPESVLGHFEVGSQLCHPQVLHSATQSAVIDQIGSLLRRQFGTLETMPVVNVTDHTTVLPDVSAVQDGIQTIASSPNLHGICYVQEIHDVGSSNSSTVEVIPNSPIAAVTEYEEKELCSYAMQSSSSCSSESDVASNMPASPCELDTSCTELVTIARIIPSSPVYLEVGYTQEDSAVDIDVCSDLLSSSCTLVWKRTSKLDLSLQRNDDIAKGIDRVILSPVDVTPCQAFSLEEESSLAETSCSSSLRGIDTTVVPVAVDLVAAKEKLKNSGNLETRDYCIRSPSPLSDSAYPSDSTVTPAGASSLSYHSLLLEKVSHEMGCDSLAARSNEPTPAQSFAGYKMLEKNQKCASSFGDKQCTQTINTLLMTNQKDRASQSRSDVLYPTCKKQPCESRVPLQMLSANDCTRTSRAIYFGLSSVCGRSSGVPLEEINCCVEPCLMGESRTRFAGKLNEILSPDPSDDELECDGHAYQPPVIPLTVEEATALHRRSNTSADESDAVSPNLTKFQSPPLIPLDVSEPCVITCLLDRTDDIGNKHKPVTIPLEFPAPTAILSGASEFESNTHLEQSNSVIHCLNVRQQLSNISDESFRLSRVILPLKVEDGQLEPRLIPLETCEALGPLAVGQPSGESKVMAGSSKRSAICGPVIIPLTSGDI